ncbi:MAG: nuclear transport factor 2 family protein [Leptothrix sp. (in: b-proteobacteria)]
MNSPIDTVQQIYAAFGRGDLAFILDQLDDDVSWGIDSVAAGEVPPYGLLRGRQGVTKFFAAWAETADFLSFEPRDFVVAGDQVFNHLAYTAKVRATGRTVQNFSLQHWTLRNGKVLRWRGYEDTAATRDAWRAQA